MHLTRIGTASPEAEALLLLREFAHRAMNELAVAQSAVAIARRGVAARAPGQAAAVLDEAGSRLASVGDLMLMLARPMEATVDLGAELDALCRATLASRPDAARAALDLDLPETRVDGVVARRVALIAAELVANACRHALAGRAGTLSMRLCRAGSDLVLEVGDDGSGPAVDGGTQGTGLGSGIVTGLARLAGGSVALARGSAGTVARLTVPTVRGMAIADAC